MKKKFRKILFAAILPFAAFFAFYTDRIYPGIKVAGILLAGQSTYQVIETLKQNFPKPKEVEVVLIEKDSKKSFKINLNSIDFDYDFEETSQRVFGIARSGNPFFDVPQIITNFIAQKNYGLSIKLNEEKLQNELALISGQVSVQETLPSVSLVNKKIIVEAGKPGLDIDKSKLRTDIGQVLTFAKAALVNFELKTIDHTLKDKEIKKITLEAEKLIAKKITISFEYTSLVFNDEDLIDLLSITSGVNKEKISKMVEEISKKIEREPQDAKFSFESGFVNEFVPAKEGIKINKEALETILAESFNKLATTDTQEITLEPPLTRRSPSIKTADVNNLGIKELIGRGSSKFAGSIPSRIHNIKLAASKLNGTLVAPGTTFSFTQTLGDISMFTGYKQAYIIQDGKTILGDGGGVCQVSTTLFRAVLNTGLPIVERVAHAYRVGYYEQDSPAGFDATIYSPSPDLKFTNNTPAHILIQSQVDLANLSLVFEIYGTQDGRKVTLSKPIITEVTPPPADLYIDDPTLPLGTVKQIDYRARGAKVNFQYKVEKDGQVLFEKTFYSNYQPWQAKFLKGTMSL